MFVKLPKDAPNEETIFIINDVWTRAAFTRKACIELSMTAAFVVAMPTPD